MHAALAALVDGLEAGLNAKSALLARGLAEIGRLQAELAAIVEANAVDFARESERDRDAFRAGLPTTMVMQELEKPRETLRSTSEAWGTTPGM